MIIVANIILDPGTVPGVSNNSRNTLTFSTQLKWPLTRSVNEVQDN